MIKKITCFLFGHKLVALPHGDAALRLVASERVGDVYEFDVCSRCRELAARHY